MVRKAIKVNYIISISLALLIICCNNRKSDINIDNKSDAFYLCDTTQFSKTLDAINENPNRFLKVNEINDPCILRVVDALLTHFIKESKIEYIEGLENLFKESDGYLAYYFINSIGFELFKDNFNGSLKYIYLKKDSEENVLAGLFIDSIIMQIEKERVTKYEIDKFFDKKLESNELTDDQKSYLISIKNRIDDRMMDIQD